MKRIVILEQIPGQNVTYKYALIALVPVARRPKYAGVTSVIPDLTQPEIDAFTSGTVTEKIETISLLPESTLQQIQELLIQRAAAYQTEIDDYNPWDRLGTFWDDDTGWTGNGIV